MTRETTRGALLLALGALAAALMLVGCGGSEQQAEPETTQAAPAETEAPTETGTPAETGAADTGAAAGGEGTAVAEDVIPEGEEVNVCVFTVAGNTYLQATVEEMRKVAGANNATLTLIDSGFDAQKQYNQVQDQITARKCDAFAISPIDSTGVVPVVEDAVAAGIPVVAFNTPVGGDLTTTEIQVPGVAGSILRPASDYAEAWSDIALDLCAGEDPCTVVWIPGVLKAGGAFDVELKKVFDQMAADNPTIDLIIGPDSGFLADPAYKAMQDILQAHDKIDVVIASDQMALGAEKAIDDDGRAGEMEILGAGGSEPAVEAVREGAWYADLVSVPRDEGREAMEMAIIAARGGEINNPARYALDYAAVPATISQDNKSDWETTFQGQWKG